MDVRQGWETNKPRRQVCVVMKVRYWGVRQCEETYMLVDIGVKCWGFWKLRRQTCMWP